MIYFEFLTKKNLHAIINKIYPLIGFNPISFEIHVSTCNFATSNFKDKKMKRSVEQIISAPPVHMVGDGFRVHNFIPGRNGMGMRRTDPFIMMDYNSPHYFPPTTANRGVGVHPHRGFETVTIAYQGKLAHHDSAGNSGVIGEGDVQWMSAASGVLHKEYHEENFAREGGIFQMVQLWVNLPAKYKMNAPKYQGIENEEIPRVAIEKGGRVEVIAGSYQGIAGKAKTYSPVHLLNLHLDEGAEAPFDMPAYYNTMALVIEGSIEINGENKAIESEFILFANDGNKFNIKALKNTKVLILSGEPLNEPIAAQGPFVMNTREELMMAYYDLQKGKFGVLED